MFAVAPYSLDATELTYWPIILEAGYTIREILDKGCEKEGNPGKGSNLTSNKF